MTDAVATETVDEAAEIKRLAGLSPLDYDRAREAAAKKLGVRGETLDSVVAPLRKTTEPPKPTKAQLRYGNPPKGKRTNSDPTLRQLAAARERATVQKGA